MIPNTRNTKPKSKNSRTIQSRYNQPLPVTIVLIPLGVIPKPSSNSNPFASGIKNFKPNMKNPYIKFPFFMIRILNYRKKYIPSKVDCMRPASSRINQNQAKCLNSKSINLAMKNTKRPKSNKRNNKSGDSKIP